MAVSAVVPFDDSFNLPVFELKQKDMSVDSYLAHDKTVVVVGGSQFFGVSPFSSLFLFNISG